MSKNSYKNLDVWENAHKLVLEIYEITKKFPPEEKFRLIDQLCRAAVSVPANIVEGHGRFSKKEFVQFLYIARGSLEEVRYFLHLALDLRYITKEVFNKLQDMCDCVGKLLNGLIRSLKQATQNQQPRTKS